MQTETIQCDVLVVGGGLAGMRAALAARREGVSVCLVLKGKLGASGNSAMAGGGYAAALGIADPEDSPAIHFADTMAGGHQINDPDLVRTMVERAPSAVRELMEMGITFAMAGDEVAQYRVPAMTYRRSLRAAPVGSAQAMAVLRAAVFAAGTRVVEQTVVAELLLREGVLAGALGYSRDQGLPILFQSGAVILATGGAGRIYPLATCHPETTGDGYALAYRAGARLADMEFVQFVPTAIAYPDKLRGTSSGGSILAQPGARLLNRLGQRFMRHYDPERMESTTRAIASRAIFREIVEGRGSDHGGVYLDLSEVDAVALSHISGGLFQRLRACGVYPGREPVEVAPAVHHCMGGIVIDGCCRTSVPGLFAAGEVAAGVHGANRLGSNALSEAAVFGTIAGRAAAAFAHGSSPPGLETSNLAATRSAAEAVTMSAETAERGAQGLRAIMLAGAGLERQGQEIDTAVSELHRLRSQLSEGTETAPGNRFRSIELRNMLDVGEIVLRSARLRNESRGAHYRCDFPDQDDARWLANIVVTRGTEGPVLETKSAS